MRLIEWNVLIFVVLLSISSEIGCQFEDSTNKKNVTTSYSIPKYQLPISVLTYLETVHPKAKVVKVEKFNSNDKTYKIQLADGLQLIFDSEANFIKMDSIKIN